MDAPDRTLCRMSSDAYNRMKSTGQSMVIQIEMRSSGRLLSRSLKSSMPINTPNGAIMAPVMSRPRGSGLPAMTVRRLSRPIIMKVNIDRTNIRDKIANNMVAKN